MLPRVIIIGRPNVGKSTLFNRLVGKKLALVDDQPGVTRDRRFGDAEIAGLEFQVVDTAGWEDEDPASLPGRMRKQTEVSLEGADAALFVFDSRLGLTPLDEEIARWLRGQEVPVVLVANKAEGSQGDAGIFESFSLGFGEPAAISAEHGEGIADLFDHLWPIIGAKAETAEIEAQIDEEDEEALLAGPLKLAIVGRPNAGKSTLINRLLGEDRLLTGPEAGITRDSIAIDWEWNDPRSGEMREIRLIDTAGMRKKAQVVDKLERLSVADARRAVDFAEVVVLLLDATRGLEAQDLKIANMVLEEGRALMIAINKWDVAEGASALFNGIRDALNEGLAQVRGVPLFAVSAKTGKGLDQMLGAAFRIAVDDIGDEAEIVLHRPRRTETVEGVDDEIGVAQPAEAIVPVALRARRLRDRGGQRRRVGLLVEIGLVDGRDHRRVIGAGDGDDDGLGGGQVARAVVDDGHRVVLRHDLARGQVVDVVVIVEHRHRDPHA